MLLKLLRVLAILRLLALPVSSAPAALQAPAARDVAARAGEFDVSWAEYDRLLVDRYALSESGRLALHHLLKARVLDHLAREGSFAVPAAVLEARVAEIQGQLGSPEAFLDYLRREGVAPELFREYLRLGIVQETLARRALDIPAGDPITGEQQELWLESVMNQMGVKEHPAPWADGLVCACGPVKVELPAFLEHLRQVLDPAEQRDGLYQLLLAEAVTKRMPDLTAEAVEAALLAEVERRRVNVERDPKYQGISYEQLLQSQGIRFEAWQHDPSVRIQALSQMWVERSYSDADMKRVYTDEREHFDGIYGEAIEVWAIFLKAVKFENELMKRTFEEAESELYELSTGIRARAEFEALAEKLSEDEGTRAAKGRIGFVTRAGQERHLALKSAIFAAYDEKRFDPSVNADSRRRLLGPVRTSTGCVLFWLGELRPTPGWETMALYVREELRARFLEETLSVRGITTYLDRE